MRTQVIFAQFALALLSILASQKADAAVSCVTAGGVCRDADSAELEGCVSVEGKCKRNMECCLDVTRGGNDDRKCNRAGGKCKRRNDCNRHDILDKPCSGNRVCCDDGDSSSTSTSSTPSSTSSSTPSSTSSSTPSSTSSSTPSSTSSSTSSSTTTPKRKY
nr:protein SLG1-like [Penaeus vannamei]